METVTEYASITTGARLVLVRVFGVVLVLV